MQTKIENIITVQNLSKSFDVASGKVEVLKNLTFDIKEGSFTIIFGPSGCGKSTLLHTILGLEEPTQGTVKIAGKEMYRDLTPNSSADFRKNNIGMVYQQAHWVKSLNVLENTALPLRLLGVEKEARTLKAQDMLKAVNMLGWSEYHPSELSSGQQQKVSLSRALISGPQIIIADEPTGNLDFESGEELILILKKINQEQGKTIIMVTHDLEYLEHADTCIKLLNGEVESIFSPKDNPTEMKKVNFKKEIYEKVK
jgi:putative ABC transport system ATP-binding protein